jgi:uncharacterized protein YegP (UPF0339 family)
VAITFYLTKSKTARQPYFWYCKSDGNHEELCRSSETYSTKAAAQHSLNLVRAGAPSASVLDLTTY